jgi:hypothetical protein
MPQTKRSPLALADYNSKMIDSVIESLEGRKKARKTRAYPSLVKQMGKVLGTVSSVHEPTKENRNGITSIETVADDLFAIMGNSITPAQAIVRIVMYFQKGEMEI